MELLRLIAVALLLLLPIGALHWGTVPAAEDMAQLGARMPSALGGWTAVRDEQLDTGSLEMLEPTSYVLRLYTAHDGPQIWAYVALYDGGIGRVDAHDPAVCYPAQGWSITEQRELSIDVGSLGSFPALFLRNEMSGAEELVLYWFQPAGRWPHAKTQENLLRVFDRVRGRPGYAFIRLSYRRARSDPGVSQADLDRLVSLATSLAPWAREAVAAPASTLSSAGATPGS